MELKLSTVIGGLVVFIILGTIGTYVASSLVTTMNLSVATTTGYTTANYTHQSTPPGTPYAWTVPTGVTSISFTIVGAGGGGGSGNSTDDKGGEAGHNGSITTVTSLAITPGTVLTIKHGLFGAGGVGTTNGNGAAGTNSSVTIGTALYNALGGAGGLTSNSTNATSATSGMPGLAGWHETDPTGPSGDVVSSITFVFNPDTTEQDPMGGCFAYNTVAPPSASKIFISDHDAYAKIKSGEIETWDDSTSTVKGHLYVWDETSYAILYHTFQANSLVKTIDGDGTVWYTLGVTWLSGTSVLGSGNPANLTFIHTGFAQVGDSNKSAAGGAGGTGYGAGGGGGASASWVVPLGYYGPYVDGSGGRGENGGTQVTYSQTLGTTDPLYTSQQSLIATFELGIDMIRILVIISIIVVVWLLLQQAGIVPRMAPGVQWYQGGGPSGPMQ